MLADSYDAEDNLVKTAAVYNRTEGSLPCTWELCEAFWQLGTSNWTVIGGTLQPPYSNAEFTQPQSPGTFNPEQMAASASF